MHPPQARPRRTQVFLRTRKLFPQPSPLSASSRLCAGALRLPRAQNTGLSFLKILTNGWQAKTARLRHRALFKNEFSCHLQTRLIGDNDSGSRCNINSFDISDAMGGL